MTIAYCKSFGLELLQGTHVFGTDTFKAALFDGSADFDVDTTAYSTTNEVTMEGYTAGGATLSLSSGYPQIENDRPGVRFENPSWTFVDPGTVRWVLIYNASKSNRAVLSIDMGQGYRVFGAFEVTIPLSAPPLVQIAFPVVR
jgi:hypothetical protein